MVLGHAGAPLWVNSYLNMMHMPLFFFMSGYCFKESYLYGGKKWLAKRVKGIYWPYVKWGIVFVLMHNVFLHLHIYSETFEFHGRAIHPYTLQETLVKMVSVITMHGTERLLGGFWFLRALLYGSLLFYATCKFIPNRYVGSVFLLAASFLTCFFHMSVPYFRIGSLDLLAAFFIMIGCLFKTIVIRHSTLAKMLISNLWVSLVFAIIVGIGSVYWPASMLNYSWSGLVPYAITAIMGTIVIFSIGHRINNWDLSAYSGFWLFVFSKIRGFLIYTGGYTFNVLTWHFLSFKLVNLIIIVFYGLSLERLGDFPGMSDYVHEGWSIAYLFIGVVIPISGTYIYHIIVDRNK